MYPLRLFSKLPSPKKLEYEEFEECSIENEDGAESICASTPRSAFVTTRGGTGGGGHLSPPELVQGSTEVHFKEFDLSPPKAIQLGRKPTPASLGGADIAQDSRKHDQSAAVTPVRAAKRRTKLTWQSRASPEKQKKSRNGRSPSSSLIQYNNPRLDSTSVSAAIKSLQQSASFSGVGCKEVGFNNVMLGQGHAQSGGGDSMPSTPRGSRKPRNSELTSSITSLGSVTSVATPRSASRSLRHGGPSTASYALTAVGVSSTRAMGIIGSGARAIFQNQQAAQFSTESHFKLEVDPTFWQDHSVQVLIRTRPINLSEAAQRGHGRCVRQESAHTITWIGQPETRFTFDHVAGESVSQEELFRVAGLPMVENCIAGYNSCMFAYGQTGSGKTHTMLGDISDLDHQPSDKRGMTPRVFESLFAKIKMAEESQNHENLKFKCRCSFLEIYNEQIADLLEPSSSNLQMREDASKGVYVEGLLEVEVQNVQDVLHLLLLGAANRRVAATNMNKESSRSHSVFTCIIESQWECDDMINFRFGRLNLVDLAGSERQRASGADGERLKEAASINKSLSTLGLVIMVLVETANGKQRHVPYRDSKLTFLLQDSLGGNSKTTIIANISPSSCASLETLSTLKFAQRAKFIQNNAVINEDSAGDVNALRQQIQQLKDELARLRRQSISRIPTGRASAVFRQAVIEEGNPSNSEQGFNSLIENIFLQSGRTFQSPTVLNTKIKSLEAVLAGALRREQAAESSLKISATEIQHLTRLVKQREEETQCSKMILRFREDKIKRMETLLDGGETTDMYLVKEKSAALQELQLLRDEKDCNPEVTKFAMENMRLLEQLRKFQEFRSGGEREAMAQEISDLRDQLADVLDSKLSLDSLAHTQRDASAAELAAERHQLGLLCIEVDSYRTELNGCRTSLSACLASNDEMGRQLDDMRKELERANELCSKYKKELKDIQETSLEVDCLKLKEAQHQQILYELKAQLRKSEEKALEEANAKISLKKQLKPTILKNDILEAKIQRTADFLETAEMLLKELQLSHLSPVGLNQNVELGSNQAHTINKLQLELDELKASLGFKCFRGRGLEDPSADPGINTRRGLQFVTDSGSYDLVEHTRVRHQDAILQLQLELDTIDGAPESAIESYRWEEGTRNKVKVEDAEVSSSVTIMQLQLDLESAESRLEEERRSLKEVELSRAQLQKQLEETVSQLQIEKGVALRLKSCGGRTQNEIDSLRMDHKGIIIEKASEEESNLKQKITQRDWEHRRYQELCSVEGREYALVDDHRKLAFSAEIEDRTHDIPSLPLEPSELRDEVAGALEREASARSDVTRLSDLLKDKEAEICTVQQDWEAAAAKMIDFLAGNKLSVDALCSQPTQEFFNTCSSRGKKITDRTFCKIRENQTAVMTLVQQLQSVRERADSFRCKLGDSLLRDCTLISGKDHGEEVRQSRFQSHRDLMALKVEEESCGAYLREVESKAIIVFIMVWWLSETADLRCVAEDRRRVELTEAVAKIQERQGVLFSLQLEREKTPERESREVHPEAQRVHKELAAWEEERIRLAAKNERFETQARKTEKMLEYLLLQLETAKQRLQTAIEKSSGIAEAQSGLVIVKENWNLKEADSGATVAEAELQFTLIKEELTATKAELQRLEAHTHIAVVREEELQNERANLEKELKQHLEAVQVLADDLQNQIELKEQENLRLKEQMAEQHEDWVLEKSDLLVANREADFRCSEKNKAITSLQKTIAKLQGQVSDAGYKPRVQNAKMYKLLEDEVGTHLEERVEELKEAVDRLTAENLELRNEKLFLSEHSNKFQDVAQKEVESSVLQRKLLDAEEHHRQAESTVTAPTQLVEELSSSEKSCQSEKEFSIAEVERLQSCVDTTKLELQTCQEERDSCLKRIAEMNENKNLPRASGANSLRMKVTKNEPVELTKAHIALASSEEKVKLLTEMVSTMGEDWAAERQNWICEKEDLRMELARLEQHTDFRRSSDQPLRNLSENRSLPAPDASFNIKNVDKLRHELEKVRTENAKFRSRAREQDQAYLSVRMELSAAHAKQKDLELEMDKIVAEKQHLLQNELDFQKQLETISLEVTRRQAHIQSCESELQRLTMLQLKSEEEINAAEQTWREEKAQLEAEREAAQVEANEKRNEAAAMLVKFEEWKTTLREADSMVNALVRVNEKAKERWKREKERLASSQIEETNKVVQEMLDAVTLTKEQVDMTMGHAEGEIRALVAETQIMRLDMTHEILKLKRDLSGNIPENSSSIELLPSVKCIDSERQSWAHQVKAASVVLAQKEAEIRTLQAEVDKARKQLGCVQSLQSGTQSLLQEKEKMILKLVNELNHLNQSMNRDRSLRKSLTRDVDNVTSLRRSFSYKPHVERDSTLLVLKEEQEQLKTMIFNLEVENAEMQEQLLEAETKTKALELTIEHFRKSDHRWVEEVRSLEEQLEESARHVNELEMHRMELRDEMQRQAASFAELYEQLQKQEGALEGESRAIANKVAAEKEVLHTLQEEKAELKIMVERLDAELNTYEKKACQAASSQAELDRLQLEMEGLQKELLRIDILQKEIVGQNVKLDDMSLQRTMLEADLASKNKELGEIAGELESKRILAELTTRESERLKGQVKHLVEKASALEEDVVRKRTAIKALEAELMAVEETMARFLEDASVDLKELEIERDNLQIELRVLTEQLQEAQALADEQTAIADEACQNAEASRICAAEKQVEAEILGRSVVELESTVYALESQLGLVRRESERQRLMREDMEMELQGLKNNMSVMQAALEEASSRSADDLLEAQCARQEAERKLDEKEAEMQLAQAKLRTLQEDSEMKAEKMRFSKIQIAQLLAEAQSKAAEYEQKLKAVETKLDERANTQPSISRGPKLKGAWSTFACIGKGHQVNSEANAKRQMYERRIQELEIELSNQQYEVSILTGKLGVAERMTSEVLRDLLGVKTDMTNVASLLGQQEQNASQAQKGPLEKDDEVEHLLQRLNELIEERESWLEEISRKHSDLLAAQDAIGNLQQRERLLCTEIESTKDELKKQQKLTADLDHEVKKLSGQQNLQQRIKHHAKIKDENNLLRIQNDELSGKLRRTKLLHVRLTDELAKYRIAEGKTPLLNFDEEDRLRTKVQELEEQKIELSEMLRVICARVVETAGQAAGDTNLSRDGELAVAFEALHLLKTRLESTQKDLEDYRLKVKIVDEKQKLNDLRTVQSPLKDIGSFGALNLAPR